MITLSSPVFTVRKGAAWFIDPITMHALVFAILCVALREPRQADENLWRLIELAEFMQAHILIYGAPTLN